MEGWISCGWSTKAQMNCISYFESVAELGFLVSLSKILTTNFHATKYKNSHKVINNILTIKFLQGDAMSLNTKGYVYEI
jgi:hypothetical protein